MESRFLLFKASAGSGKTYNLAVQYLSLLVSHDASEYQHTLAVTFTNKATAEMKERILEQLYGVGYSLQQSDDYLASVQKELHEHYHLSLSDEEVRKRCRAALSHMLHNYNRFYVSTIDAFFQMVFRNMAHELGLGARLQVDLDDKEVVKLAIDRLIDDLRHDDKNTLPWLRDIIYQRMREGKVWDIREELIKLSRCLFSEIYLTRDNNPENVPLTIESVSQYQKTLRKEKAQLANQIKEPLERLQEAFSVHQDACSPSIAKYIQKYISAMEDGDLSFCPCNTLLTAMNDASKLLYAKDKKDTAKMASAEILCSVLNNLRDKQAPLQTKSATIDSILAAIPLLGLLSAIRENVDIINNENSRYPLSRTPLVLSSMLQSDSPFIFEKIGTQFNNVMIDEFQDTSNLQWKNFSNLLIDNLASGGLGMVVGDLKQSIYRFRNGDWTLLHNLEHLIHNATIDNRPLDTNHRSLGGVIHFNNWFFDSAKKNIDRLFPDAENKFEDLYRAHEQNVPARHDDGGYIRIHLCDSEDKEEKKAFSAETQYAEMCEAITRLHNERQVAYADMAILLRNNECDEMLEYISLHLPNVPIVSNEAFLLGSSIAARMIIAALKVLHAPKKNRVALRVLMKLYGVHVLHLAADENAYCLHGSAHILPEEFTSRVAVLRKMPLYELCEELYHILRLEEIPNEDAYMLCFFDELTTYLRDGLSDLTSFLEYWDDKLSGVAAPAGDIDGIRILTIHKSKGLEYKAVFMPNADWNIEDDRNGRNRIWAKPESHPMDELGTIYMPMTSAMKENEFCNDYVAEHARQRADEVNVLYVAFTRAEEYLYVWGVPSGKDLTNVADLMLTVLEDEDRRLDATYEDGVFEFDYHGVKCEEPGSRKKDVNRIVPPFDDRKAHMCSHKGNIEFRHSNQTEQWIRDLLNTEQSRQESFYIQQGILFHEVMARIRTAEDLDSILRECSEQGLFPDERLERSIASLFRRGMDNPMIADWFSGEWQLFNECALLSLDPKSGLTINRRPDRVMIRDKEIVVVDYKFGKPQKEHHEQVNLYINILHQMMPEYTIHGYLWYVYKNEIKEA